MVLLQVFLDDIFHSLSLDKGEIHVVSNVKRISQCSSGYLTVCYIRIETIHLPRILNSKSVRDTIPYHKPPMVSFSYTNTISGRIFYQ